MHTKDTIRKTMRDRRERMPVADVRAFSAAAQGHILADEAWRAARNVGLYVAVRHEVETALLAAGAWASGKRVFFPHTPPGETGVMYFLPCGPDERLAPNRFGIPEPCPENRPSAVGCEDPGLDLLIVPGTAFDMQGRRIGSGGGYYDRFLAGAGMAGALRIALAYSFQVLGDLPAEDWDAPVHAIATEEGLTWL